MDLEDIMVILLYKWTINGHLYLWTFTTEYNNYINKHQAFHIRIDFGNHTFVGKLKAGYVIPTAL